MEKIGPPCSLNSLDLKCERFPCKIVLNIDNPCVFQFHRAYESSYHGHYLVERPSYPRPRRIHFFFSG